MTNLTVEFREWTPEVRSTLSDLIGNVEVSRLREKDIAPMFMGAFETRLQNLEETLLLLGHWVLQAQQHCKAMIKMPGLGYKDLIFVILSDGREIDLMPMMEGEVQGETHRFTLAAAIVVHPQKSNYAFYFTNEQGWQDWLNEEKRLLASPLDNLIADDKDDSNYFETENHYGSTHYAST